MIFLAYPGNDLVWRALHMLCREIVLHDMYQHKDGSWERGQCLDRIAESLNSLTTIWFKVDQRALRGNIKKLLQLYVTKRNKEECSSGISPGHTELHDLLQEVYEWKKESEANYHQQSSEIAKQIKKEKEDIKTKSLERLSETRKREAEDQAWSCSSHNEKRCRSSGSDAIAYLWEKSEKYFQLREAELKLRREELELKKSRETLLWQQSQIMMTVLSKLADKIWKTENFKGSSSVLVIVYVFELLLL